MLVSLKARGPDGEGLFSEGPLTLGHRRLAILDLSEAAAQPMESHGGRFVVSFNGEIYNFRELAADLSIPSGSLRTSSDTEILLLAWERWGSSCLDRLVGQWAFAMYDRQEERLWLVRDRFGEKPLFYHVSGGTLTFASSIPSLFAAPWISREVDPEALAEYLTLRYVVSPRTLLRDVRKIPPGHLLIRDAEGQRTRSWWSPRFRMPAYANSSSGRSDATREFGNRLVQASSRCLVGDVPVGLLLSDGIDSNSIRAALDSTGAQVRSYTYRALTARRVGADDDMSPKAGASSRLQIDATYDELSRHVEPAFSSMTEPVGDGSALATYFLIRGARPHATVFLCGHGGDELLGGYRLSQERFRLAAMGRLCRLPLRALDRMVEGYTNGQEDVTARRYAIAHAPRQRIPAAARYLIQRPLPFDDLRTLFAPRPVPGTYLGVVDRLYAEASDDAPDIDLIQEVMLRTFLSENLLSLADSVAMASSAELRLPYLDRDLADLVFQLPPAMRVSRWPGLTNTKMTLRWWARKRLSEDVLKRRKRGFRFGSIRNHLRSEKSRIRELVMGSRVLRRHLGGLEAWTGRPIEVYRRGRETAYWSLLALATWSEAAGVS